ncbi:Glycosyltransferase, catalytic subunit of cellulose synthase and poly-beta-1,6-N-acetylglucosamine synthase [Nostoc flagelliforme CCNUN1]|uniref:Glycosyltransferase, catalytic subunit of cellulose synthase and poly-beta-1,6-N-acetylglucosamine synthase n=1 Tax=Nostoc flagelliforme CCNUN1 TaxID=2038116 RepID=A0A2K8T0R9_9NOSO|nr:glycosyltransferase [Nostoc flagelliforme]AUB41230.1 Glycosyltransferase, catalytic subunit of cellulose synthase and poly-beta-1,6-N-acetylglucosamine synthase [Nostoc flagelliforme CCNUN1]
MGVIVLGLMLLSLTIWLGLLCFWGQFWRTDQQLEVTETQLESLPVVCAVVPARNEAELLPTTLRSLLLQDYPGSFNVFLVDDRSTDQTANFAEGVAHAVGKPQQLHIISGESLPSGWSGKLWAVEQGIKSASKFAPDYFLLTDADIEHDPGNLRRLVAKAVQEDLDLISVMVRLRCESFWEKLLIPGFVFFFQKLYPFRWVNNPNNPTAAAAGGSILIAREALERIGGIQVIRQALIDDCALAQAVKKSRKDKENTPCPMPNQGRIWLGLSSLTRSLRPYDSLATIWDMVARTAYTQLNYSPLLLLGTLVGMPLIYLVPPMCVIIGAVWGNWAIALTGLLGWLLMSLAYYPTIRFYKCSPWLAFSLPAIAFLYTLMTLDSALRHWQGRGGAWKGRVYPNPDNL